MRSTIRQFAVSGSAAVALLGGAAAVGVVTAPQASAVETRTVVETAVTAPVQMPGGRTIRITGMGGYGHTATADHVAAVSGFKADTDPSADPNVGTGLTPDNGSGYQLQNPYNQQQVPAGYNQQITTQASGGTIGVGIVSILILGIIVWFKIKHGGLKVSDAALGVVAGVAVGGTFLGPTISSMTNSLVGSLGSAISGL